MSDIINDVVDHTANTWEHVFGGPSTTAEKLEVGGELLAGTVALVALGKWAGLGKAASEAEELVLPRVEVGAVRTAGEAGADAIASLGKTTTPKLGLSALTDAGKALDSNLFRSDVGSEMSRSRAFLSLRDGVLGEGEMARSRAFLIARDHAW
jgi:hypothetical protein